MRRDERRRIGAHEPPRLPSAIRSSLLDLDLALGLHGLGLLGGRDLEHALVELGLDLGVIDGVGQANGTAFRLAGPCL